MDRIRAQRGAFSRKGFRFSYRHGATYEKLNPIELKRGRLADPKAEPSYGEKGQLRAVIGGIGWAARQARLDEAATAFFKRVHFVVP
eukprot:6523829-Pyramimonas_sp.AAC.1